VAVMVTVYSEAPFFIKKIRTKITNVNNYEGLKPEE
jgi:hypothetical protein